MDAIFKTIHFDIMDFFFQCFNILIIIFFLNKFLFKKVGKILDSRKIEIEKTVYDVKKSKENIMKEEKKYINLINNAKKECKNIIFQSSREGEKIKLNLIKKAEEEANNILEKAKIDIKNEKEKALVSIKKELSLIIAESIKVILKKEINEKIQNKIISNFVEKIGESDG